MLQSTARPPSSTPGPEVSTPRLLAAAPIPRVLVLVLLAVHLVSAAGAATVQDPIEHLPDVEFARVSDMHGTELVLAFDAYVREDAEDAEDPLPVAVYIHGGGYSKGTRKDGAPQARALAAHGYFSVTIDYRLMQQMVFPASLHDCKAAVRYLRDHAEELGIDPDRIGVWGHSAGGHLSALLGTTGNDPDQEGDVGVVGYSSVVQCVADVSGPTDIALLMGLPEGGASAFRTMMDRASPMRSVDAGDPPFLILHGTDDETIPIRHAEMLDEALREAGVPVQFARLPGAAHLLDWDEVYEMVGAFFDEHLKHSGADSAGPQDAAASDADVARVVAECVALLLKLQENYVPESVPPAEFADDEAERRWWEEERQRLEVARRDFGAPQEWPYHSVSMRITGERPEILMSNRVGGTALVAWSLLEAPGLALDPERQAALRRALEFLLDRFENDRWLNADSTYRFGQDRRIWAHCYGLTLLSRLLVEAPVEAVEGPHRDRCREVAQELVRRIEALEVPAAGGWSYAQAIPQSFTTATVLQALFFAQAADLDVDPEVVGRGVELLQQARRKSGTYYYYVFPDGGASEQNRSWEERYSTVAGSAARRPVCETTLDLAGESSPDALRAAVAAFFASWDRLEARRGAVGNHEPEYGIAPYYFYYGHLYAAQAIERLDEPYRRELRSRLRTYLLRTRDTDGSFNDQVYPRARGCCTALALLALLQPDLEAPERADR